MTNAVAVFAGGGVAGIAWELGVVLGLTETEPKLAEFVFAPTTGYIGTSAGAAVAAQLASGTPLTELYAAQLSDETAEFDPKLDLSQAIKAFTDAATAEDPEEGRRIVGRIALDAPTVSEEARLVSIRARLPKPEWPDRDLIVPAVDASSGEPRFFDKESGVSLLEAVAASCAVPGIWPPVTIGENRYIDGGARSVANADRAVGADAVLILAPISGQGAVGFGSIPPSEFQALSDSAVATVYADSASTAAFGANPLDPATRPEAARSGREVGRREAARVASELGL